MLRISRALLSYCGRSSDSVWATSASRHQSKCAYSQTTQQQQQPPPPSQPSDVKRNEKQELDRFVSGLKTEMKNMKQNIELLKATNADSQLVEYETEKLSQLKEQYKKKIKEIRDSQQQQSKSESAASASLSSDTFSSKIFNELIKSLYIYDSAFSIYGGASGLFDLGPLGCAIQNNLVSAWRRHFVLADKMLEVDCPVLTPRAVLKASGHEARFGDLVVCNAQTGESYRVDHLLRDELTARLSHQHKLSDEQKSEYTTLLDQLNAGKHAEPSQIDALIAKLSIRAPTKEQQQLMACTDFNLMLRTEVGAAGKPTVNYLRPETAQGIFANFKRLHAFNSMQLPLVCAQVGKAYRNEINPKFGLVRQREFLLAEIEHFVSAVDKHQPYHKFKTVCQLSVNILSAAKQESETQASAQLIKLEDLVKSGLVKSETVAYYMGRMYQFVVACGIDESRVRFRQHMSTEMAHYAADCWDMECHTSIGWLECAGLADRGDYDLKQHAKANKSLSALEPPEGDQHEKNFTKAAKQLANETKNTKNSILAADVKMKTASSSRSTNVDAKQSWTTDAIRITLSLVDMKTLEKCVPSLSDSDRLAFLECAANNLNILVWQVHSQLAYFSEKKTLRLIPNDPLRTTTIDESELCALLDIKSSGNSSLPNSRPPVTSNVSPSAPSSSTSELAKSLPHVIEPSFGIGRIMYTLLEHSMRLKTKYSYFALPIQIAPYKCCVMAGRSKQAEQADIVNQLSTQLDEQHLAHSVERGHESIGRRYAYADRMGTPYTIVVDDRTTSNGQVTMREATSQAQILLPVGEVAKVINDLYLGKTNWKSLTQHYELIKP